MAAKKRDVKPPTRVGDDEEENSAFARSAFDFPGSAAADRAVPGVLVGICAVLVILTSLQSDDGGSGWGRLLKLVLVALLYGAVIFPIVSTTVNRTARAVGMALPRGMRWKTFAVFMVPPAVGYFLWNSSAGGFGSLILGAIGGTIVAAAVWWILVRVKMADAAGTFIVATMALFVSLPLAAMVMIVLNLVLGVVLDKSTMGKGLTGSPLGPQFTWNVTKEEPKPATARKAKPATEPAVAVAPAPAVEMPTAPPTPPAEAPTPAPPPAAAVNNTETAPAPAAESTARAANEKKEATETAEETTALSDYEVLFGVGKFNELVRPLKGGAWIVSVKHTTGGDDALERWSTTPLARKGQLAIKPEAAGAGKYIISPSGEHLVRLVTFPRLGAQVWSFDTGKMVRTIDLDSTFGEPELIGFCAPDLFLIHRRKPPAYGVEVIDAKAGKKLRQIVLPAHDQSLGSMALMPDGKELALVGRAAGEDAALFLVDLTINRPVQRKIKITSIDPRWSAKPVGIAFSPEGRRVSAFFEESGNGLVATWNLADTRAKPSEHVFPAGALPSEPAHARMYSAGDFVWLADGKHWLIRGRGLVNVQQGNVVMDLGVKDSVDRWEGEQGALWYVVGAGDSTTFQVATGKLRLDNAPKP